MVPYMKKKALKIENLSNKVVIIGDSMLNNIKSCGLSKLKEVDVLNFPGAGRADVLTKIRINKNDKLNKKTCILNCSCWYK